MEVVYRKGEATATDVLEGLEDPPSRSAVRAMLRILEDKGQLSHRQQGKEYIFKPTRSRSQVARTSLRRLLSTFFSGSLEEAVTAYLSDPKTEISDEQLASLNELINKARKQEKGA